METIIGLLFILLPVIFKLIGKRLEQAGKAEGAGKIREISKKYLDSDSEDTEFEDIRQWFNGNSELVAQAPVETPVMKTPVEEAVPAFDILKKDKKSPILLEEDSNKEKKEKIDPKKLVVYSEIMKPKYTE